MTIIHLIRNITLVYSHQCSEDPGKAIWWRQTVEASGSRQTLDDTKTNAAYMLKH